MKPARRETIISQIVAHAPKGLGLPSNTRRNLEKMNDAKLEALYAKLQAVSAYAAKSGLARESNDAKRSELADGRKRRYERIAALTRSGGQHVPSKVGAVALVEAKSANRVIFAGGGAAPDLTDAVRIWNRLDRDSSGYADLFRPALKRWITGVSGALETPRLAEMALRSLEGPLKIDIDHYLEFICDRIGRDALRLVRNHIVHQGSLGYESVLDSKAELLLLSLTRETLEPGFMIAPGGRIRETVAIDGLAKMRSFALNYKPDIVISVSDGGKIVGDFIASAVKTGDAEVRVAKLNNRGDRVTGGWRALRECRRVLLVDDIAGNTDRFCGAHEKLVSQLGHKDIQLVAFASSIEAREQLIQEGHANIFVAHVATGVVDLPWDRTGDYRVNSKNHVFGDGRQDRFSVSKAQIRRVSESLVDTTPTQAVIPA